MQCLKIKYHVTRIKDLCVIQDYVDSEIVVAFKLKQLNFRKLQKVIYEGIADISDGAEVNVYTQLINKYAYLFNKHENKKSRNLLNVIRKYTEFLVPCFISSEAIQEYLEYSEDMINKCKLFNVLMLLDDKFPNINKFFEKSSFVKVVYSKEQYNTIDLLIGTQTNVTEIGYNEKLIDYVLAISCQEKRIEIGPLFNIKKFELPDFQIENEQDITIMHHEELLMCFFLERILFIHLFNLSGKIVQNEFFPTRNKICINRLDLQGYSELVSLYPKYLTDV